MDKVGYPQRRGPPVSAPRPCGLWKPWGGRQAPAEQVQAGGQGGLLLMQTPEAPLRTDHPLWKWVVQKDQWCLVPILSPIQRPFWGVGLWILRSEGVKDLPVVKSCLHFPSCVKLGERSLLWASISLAAASLFFFFFFGLVSWLVGC